MLAAAVIASLLTPQETTVVLPLAGEIHAANGNRFTSTIAFETARTLATVGKEGSLPATRAGRNGSGTGQVAATFFAAGKATQGEVVQLPAGDHGLPWKRPGGLGAVELSNVAKASVKIRHLDRNGKVLGEIRSKASPEKSGLREGDSFRAEFPSEGWRTNLVMFESANRPVALEITLKNSLGQVTSRTDRTLGAHEQRLLPLSTGAASIEVRVLRGPGRTHFGLFSTNELTGALSTSELRVVRRREDSHPFQSAAMLFAIAMGVLLIDRRRVKAAHEASHRSS